MPFRLSVLPARAWSVMRYLACCQPAACMRPCQMPRFALRYAPFRVAIRPVLSGVQDRLAGRSGHSRCLPVGVSPACQFLSVSVAVSRLVFFLCDVSWWLSPVITGAAGTCMPVSHGCRCQSGSVAAIVIFFLSLFTACLYVLSFMSIILQMSSLLLFKYVNMIISLFCLVRLV